MSDEREQTGRSQGDTAKLRREHVLAAVREDIASGRLSQGQRLTERELCESHGISRTVAREVIRQLHADRLGDLVPHHGLRIARLDADTVRDIYEVRCELEVLITRAFTERASDPQVAELREIFDAIESATREGDLTLGANEITRYLRHLIEVSGKSVAGEMLEHLAARMMLTRVVAMREPGIIERGVGMLGRVVERIAARDADGAEEQVRAYIDTVQAAALSQVGRG